MHAKKRNFSHLHARDVKCVNLSLALHRGVISKEERLSITCLCVSLLLFVSNPLLGLNVIHVVLNVMKER